MINSEIDVKACVDCKYYSGYNFEDRYNYADNLCKNPNLQTKDMIFGRMISPRCIDMRNNATKCGTHANYFKIKEVLR